MREEPLHESEHRCTSGKPKDPCGKTLLWLNGALVCPKCDSWPGKSK